MSRKGILTGKFRNSVPSTSLTIEARETLIVEKMIRLDNARDLSSGLPLICGELEAWQEEIGVKV